MLLQEWSLAAGCTTSPLAQPIARALPHPTPTQLRLHGQGSTWAHLAEEEDDQAGVPRMWAETQRYYDSTRLREWLVRAAWRDHGSGSRVHNELGARLWHAAVLDALSSADRLLSLPLRWSRRYSYQPGDWLELPQPAA